ncbi:MAG: SGNH/GDSL hydrolase family protein [Candidatus Omnitrophica bacterium]|nr:SGNH/GDSL hydrolase family protein [Candidatus Omnitrophota bacterium]MBU1925854.1 SGNH/GDSL hydrolase family protein [Candidatus Omnitrophota bacterium]
MSDDFFWEQPAWKGNEIFSRKIKIKLIVFLISLIFALGLGEFLAQKFLMQSHAVRISFKGDELGKYSNFMGSDDNILVYEPRDKLSSQCLKDEQNTKIVVLGDSITFCHIGEKKDYYPYKLEKLLNKDSKDASRAEVLNAGVPGYNTKQEVRYLEKRLLGYQPDIVIVGYCAANDRNVKRRIVKYEDGMYCSDFEERYPQVIFLPFGIDKYLMEKSALFRLVNFFIVEKYCMFKKSENRLKIKYFDYSYETQNAIKRFGKLAKKKDFFLLFVVFPVLINDDSALWVDEASSWAIEILEEEGIDYIDLRQKFKKVGYENIKVVPGDVCHLNIKGQNLAAEQIFDYINRTIINGQYLREN